MFFGFSNGELRFYIFLSIILGLVIYFATISKWFIKIHVSIIKYLKNIILSILRIVSAPFKKIAIFLIVKPLQILKNKLLRLKSSIFRQNSIKKLKKHKNKRRIFSKNVENINSN